MGEATYYAKLKFPDEERANGAAEEVEAFLDEMSRAYDFWQNNRSMEGNGERSTFWNKFAEEFPIVLEFLYEIKKAPGDCNNELSGIMGFGEDSELQVKEDTLYFNAYTWHLSDWTPALEFLAKKVEAASFGWISDEYVEPDYYGLISMTEAT